MASLLPGYEYDIFISYRHNDNRSGWVSDFVKALQDELATTIKEPLSIYFDSNPHDGLLETHDVDGSLKEKIKCLVLIPIVSQTYCDPKSFAWQKEFLAFIDFAKSDQYGLDIKLANGNVAKRVLPVRIHEIDEEDKLLFKNAIGGVMRPIDFIYREPGVNRPIQASDNKTDNLNRTDYRNQVNKIANSTKEIIQAIKNPKAQTATTPGIPNPKPDSANSNWKLIAIGVVLLVFAVIAYKLLIKPTQPEIAESKADNSIAVLPFADMSESKDQGWFADGLTEEILNSLTHVNLLKVVSRTSSFAFKNKNLPVQLIADSLLVNYVVEGSVRKSGSGLRITAQLIRAKDGFHIWSNTYDRDSKEIFLVQQDIASKIAQALNISLDEKALNEMHWAGTKNAEAFLAFLKGRELDDRTHQNGRFIELEGLKEANVFYEQSIALDPDFINPYLYHADFFLHYALDDDPSYKDTLKKEQAYKLFMSDLANMVNRSKDATQRDYYRLPQIMYSNDWTNFRNAIEKSLASPDATKYFKYQNFDISSLLTCLGYGPQLNILSKKLLEGDPSDESPRQQIVLTSIYMQHYQQALDEIARLGDLSSRPGMYVWKLFSMLQLGKVDEAFSLVSSNQDLDYFSYYDIKALILAKKGLRKEAKNIFETKHRTGSLYLLAVNELYGRQEANRRAAISDQKILLDFQLFRSYLLSHNNPPYDLSATPNFARKLKQAGLQVTP